MVDREWLKRTVAKIEESWKCKHCGGDIKDQILSPHEQKHIQDTIRKQNDDDGKERWS